MTKRIGVVVEPERTHDRTDVAIVCTVVATALRILVPDG
jgi:hypothetical protein